MDEITSPPYPGMATTGMSSQSATHIIIIAFIALGNIVYFSSRRSSRTGAPPEGERQ